MALTVTSPFASGTIDSASGTTITLLTGTATSDWVGRIIVLSRSIGIRGGQWRRISSFVSATEVEIEYPWRTGLDASNPDLESIPQNGDQFFISLNWADIADGSNVIDQGNNFFTVEDGLTVDGNATLFDEDFAVDFKGNFSSFRVTTNAGFIAGNYNRDGLGVNGGFIAADGPSGTSSVLTSSTSGANGGDWLWHACCILVRDSPGVFFVRGYNADSQITRYIDCNINGDLAGRYQGNRRLIRRTNWTKTNSSLGAFEPVTSAGASPGVADNIIVSESNQALRWNTSFSGSGTVTGLTAKSISDRIIQFGGANGTLRALNWDISDADVSGSEPFFVNWSSDASAASSLIEWANSLTVSSTTGGGRVAVFNNLGTEISNELSADGSYAEVELVERTFSGSANNDVLFADGVILGPFSGRFRQYGQRFNEFSFQGTSPTIFFWQKTVNLLTSAASASNALAVVNPTTADQIYDHGQATYEQSGNMQYSELITALGVTLTFDLSVTIDSGLGAVSYSLASDSVSYSAVTNGTKLTVVALGENQTLTLSQAGTQSGNWQIPATGTIDLAAGTYDLQAFTFASGSTFNLDSGTATVTVASDPGIITTGAGTINVQVPQPTLSLTGFPDGSTVILSQAGVELDTLNNATSPYTYTVGSGGETGTTYQFKVIASGKQDFFVTIDSTETTSAPYLGLDEASGQVLNKPSLDFRELMGADAAYQRIVGSDTTLNSQLWEITSWQSEWNTAVVADSPTVGEIAIWIGYLSTTGYDNISFNASTGEAN